LSIFDDNYGKKVLSRSIFPKVLIFIGLVGLTVIIMRPVQIGISAAMNHIRTNLIGRLETITGMEIRYSSIRPNIFGSFDIRNLDLVKNDNAFLSVSRIRIKFSLKELIRRKKTAIHSIQIDRLSINLDLERDRDLFAFVNDMDSGINITDFFPERPDIKIRDCSVNVADGNKAFNVQNMIVDVSGSARELLFTSKMDVQASYTDLLNKTYSISTEIALNGAWLAGRNEGKADIFLSSLVGVESIESGKSGSFFMLPVSNSNDRMLFDVSPMDFSFIFKDSTLSLNASGEKKSYNVSFDYNTETKNLDAGINCDDFLITSLVRFYNTGNNLNYLLSSAVTGNASFLMENDRAVLYHADFKSGASNVSGDSFVIRANGSDKSVSVDEFRFSASPAAAALGIFYGTFGFSGKFDFAPFTPSGTVFFNRFSLTGEENIDAVFRISSRNNEISITSEKVAIGQNVIGSTGIYLAPSENNLSIIVSGICEDEGAVNLEAILDYRPLQLETSLNLDSFSVSYITSLISPFVKSINIPEIFADRTKNTFIDAEIFIATNFSNFVYNVPNISLKSGDLNGRISFSGTEHQIVITEGIFSRDERDLLLSAQVNFFNPMELGFSININYFDLSWQIEGQILDKTTLIVQDLNGLSVYGSLSSSGAISGYFEGIDFPFPLNGRPIYLNFNISARYTSRDLWNLDIGNFEASIFSSPNEQSAGFFNNINYLKFSGSADQNGARFRDFSYGDSYGALAGTADFSWVNDFSSLQFAVNISDGKTAGENYILEGLLKDKHFSINASVSEMRADRFISKSGKMIVNGDATVSWDSISSFSAQINLASLNGELRGNSVNASARASFTNDELAVHDLKFNFAGINALLPILYLSRADGYAKMNADVRGSVMERKLESKMELNANFAQVDSWIKIKDALNSIQGSLKTGNTLYGETVHDPFSFVFSRIDGALSVSGGPRNMLRLEMDSEGNFFSSLSAPLPIRGSIVGKFTNGILDSHCSDFFMDMSTFWAMLPPIKSFNIAGGYVTGKIDIRGPILNPEFYGTGRGTSFRLQVPDYLSQDIRPIPFNVVLDGYEMTFNQISVVCGNGGGRADGWFRFENWVPRNLGMDITIPRETPVPYHLKVTSFTAVGDASGTLSMALENTLFEINANLYANNTDLGLEADNSKQNPVNNDDTPQSRRISTVVNMTITTGAVVEFIWPNSNMPILRANPEMGTVLTVFVDTQSGQYSLNSDVTIRSGEVYYFDRSFYIRSGTLVFRMNEQQFSPILSARAEIKDRSDSGPVTISMIIENEPLLSFVPRFEATPTLTQLEIYSLLGQNIYNITGTEGTENTQRFILTSTTELLTQVVANSDFFSQFTAVRQFERSVRNFLGLDMFSIRTRFLHNAVNETVAIGLDPVDRTPRVGNYFDNTTVFIGKYIGQNMFIQGMLTMRFDENNPDFGGLRFEPDIGIELESPLFNIRWDFFPYHPENWWVNDNSITLTWSRSF